ncbi:MAG: hypothetical protein WCT10_01410 [Patescibacteria group bacterium]|jgi:hypothetical protein
MVLKSNPLVCRLLELELPTADFAVFGSGPMMARGWRDSRDLDIVARGAAWDKARQVGVESFTADGAVKYVIGPIEVFDSWAPGQWDVNELIDGAELIDGVRFVSLENVIKWKRLMGRPKDLEDIKLIEDRLQPK